MTIDTPILEVMYFTLSLFDFVALADTSKFVISAFLSADKILQSSLKKSITPKALSSSIISLVRFQLSFYQFGSHAVRDAMHGLDQISRTRAVGLIVLVIIERFIVGQQTSHATPTYPLTITLRRSNNGRRFNEPDVLIKPALWQLEQPLFLLSNVGNQAASPAWRMIVFSLSSALNYTYCVSYWLYVR